MGKLTLLTGGTRCGKSSHALKLVEGRANPVFIATAQPFDEGMRDRIRKHREERGDGFTTIEEPFDLAKAIESIPVMTEIVIVDCLTVWLGNLMHRHGTSVDKYPEIELFLDALSNCPVDVVLVTNEVGMGIVPENAMSRQFRDMAGWLNQEIARRAADVILMVCGLPLFVKQDNF